ncbi:MAG TPA: M28 family peptidase, partial [Candidatus Hydrogenedentes bacterium]|nr:M28 family peptidase [Candidatus Hydrogenedentota bacterium]
MLREDVLQRCVAYAIAGIRHVIATFGPREPGGEGETRAQTHFAEQLQAWTDEVRTEPFTVRPRAFMGFLRVAGTLFLAAMLAYWLLPILALAFSSGAVAVVLLQFLFYREFLDPLYPARTSHNVVGTQRAADERKRVLILCGHADAAYEWPFHYHGGPASLSAVVIGMVIAGVFKLATDLLCVALGGPLAAPEGLWRTLGFVQWAGSPFFIAMFFFSDFRRVVPGANDNLTGSLLAIAIAKYLHETDTRFDHTEVQYLITGSEEAGLRGAKA